MENEVSKVVRCEECEYSEKIPRDPFTGKPRYDCTLPMEIIDSVASDRIMPSSASCGGCEFGKRKVEKQIELSPQNLQDLNQTLNQIYNMMEYQCNNCCNKPTRPCLSCELLKIRNKTIDSITNFVYNMECEQNS